MLVEEGPSMLPIKTSSGRYKTTVETEWSPNASLGSRCDVGH